VNPEIPPQALAAADKNHEKAILKEGRLFCILLVVLFTAVKLFHEGFEGFSPVADAVFLLGGDFRGGHAVFGQEEDGVVTEAVFTPGGVDDFAVHLPFRRDG